MSIPRACSFVFLAASLSSAAPPDLYNRIGHVFWLVDKLDAPLRAWSGLGLTGVHDFGTVAWKGEYRGAPVAGTVHLAWGHLGGLVVDMLAPVRGETAFNAFLSSHGNGIFAIVYEASPDQVAGEVARLRDQGVTVLQRVEIATDRGPALFNLL